MNRLIALVAVTLMLAATVSADVPQLINYQGRLTDSLGHPCRDDLYNATFVIYDSETGGAALWAEGQTIQTRDGLFSAVLGGVTPIDASVFAESNRWLEVVIDGETVAPRSRFTTVPFAFATAGGDARWYLEDDILYTENSWSIARYGSLLYGDLGSCVNLGMTCTTGVDGESHPFATISGGYHNSAYSTGAVGGGERNHAGYHAVVAGGEQNTADDAGFVGGGLNNVAGMAGVVGGGSGNTAMDGAAVLGGSANAANAQSSAVGGGVLNTVSESGVEGFIGGGASNSVQASHSAILGGYADTIASSAHYSYLFGIDADLTQDSTFMVDMPHIRFGDEATGYELPTEDGIIGQVMATDGAGQVSWVDASGGGGSGSTFIRWGNSTAPAGASLIYSGYSYGSFRDYEAPIGPVVIAGGDPGSSENSNPALFPLVVSGNLEEQMPPGIPLTSYVHAAVCYSDGATVTMWGTHTPPIGWSVLYRGYAMAPHLSHMGPSSCPICVESEYYEYEDASGATMRSRVYGVQVDNRFTQGHQPDTHIKCVVLKKQ